MNLDLFAIIALLATNAFFVATEFSLVKAKGVRIDSLISEGRSIAKMTKKIQMNLDNYLAACQLGITMASLGLGWVGEPAVEALLSPIFHKLPIDPEAAHGISVAVGFLLFSSMHIVVGEQVPKTFAIRSPEPVALWVSYPLHIFYLVMLPLNLLLKWATLGILSIFKVPAATHEEVFSQEELQSLVDVSRDHGELHSDKATMLSNLFAFDRGLARDVMVPVTKIDYLDLSKSIDDNMRIIHDTRHSRFPVIDGNFNNLKGVLLLKDLIDRTLTGDHVKDLDLETLCRDLPLVPELISVNSLFENMRLNRMHMVAVVDEYGAVSGLITMEDLLEEIVGEIADELDEIETEFPIEEVGKNEWLVHGLISLSQLSRVIDYDFVKTVRATTISGLFMEKLGRIPMGGDHITLEGLELTAEHASDRYLEKVRVKKVDSEKEAAHGE